MAVNPLIALGVQGVDTATPLANLANIQAQQQRTQLMGRQIDQADRRMALEERQFDLLKSKWDSEQVDADTKRRLQNNVIDSLRARSAFKVGGERGLRDFLAQNIQRNNADGLDSKETTQVLSMLDAGQVDDVVKMLDDNIMIGERLDIIKPGQDPKDPLVKDFTEGDKIVTKQYNRSTGGWDPLAEGPRFQQDQTLTEIADPTSPTGTRLVPRAQAVGQPGKPPSGMSVEVGPDGTVRMSQGRQGNGLTNSTQTQVEKDALNTGEMLAQVRSFADRFKPEYFTIGGRLDRAISGGKAKFDPALLGPEEREKYQEATRFAADLGRLQAQQINQLYGAALSEGESERAKTFVVNPTDDPIMAQQKIDSYQKYLRRAQAKYAYIRKHGLSVDDVPIDSMPDLMNQRAVEIEAELSKTMAGDELRKAVNQRLAEEFGLLN